LSQSLKLHCPFRLIRGRDDRNHARGSRVPVLGVRSSKYFIGSP
jgi:hypothetical protein